MDTLQYLTEAPIFLYSSFNPDNGTCQPRPDDKPLHWWNVAIASIFILLNGALSIALGLGIEKSLFIAATRCVIQLTIMGLILEDVFKTRNPILILMIALLLIFLGTYETVYNKSKKTYRGMFFTVLISMGTSTLLIGIIGTRFAMSQTPFWQPEKFIPTMGMLLGNCMSGMAVGISTTLTALSDKKDHVEMSLAFGASRWEAARPLAIEAVRLAMLPTINQMSVIGLISIPGMMTGQIIGGAPVMDAVKYQQIIMFMISASTAFGVLSAIIVVCTTIIDGRAQLRSEKIISKKPRLFHDVKEELKIIWKTVIWVLGCGWMKKRGNTEAERRPLL